MKKTHLLLFALLLLGCGSKPMPEVAPSTTTQAQAIDNELVKKANMLLKNFSGKYQYKNNVLYYKTLENGEKPKWAVDGTLDINDIYEELDYEISYADGVLTLGDDNPFYLNRIEDSKIFFSTGTYEKELPTFDDNQKNILAKISEMLSIDVSKSPIEMDFKKETIRNVENTTSAKRSFEWLTHGQLIPHPVERPKVVLSDLVGKKWALNLTSHDGSEILKTIEFFDKEVRDWSKMGDGGHLVVSLVLEEKDTMVGVGVELKDSPFFYVRVLPYDSRNGLDSLPLNYCLSNVKHTYIIYFEKDEEGNLIGKGKYRFIKGEYVKSNDYPNFPDFTRFVQLKDNPIHEEGTVTLKALQE